MHRIIQELIPKSDINADRNLCPITAMENLVRFFFCVISGREDLFLPLASGSYCLLLKNLAHIRHRIQPDG